MAELGESIGVPELVQDDVHSTSTCPWHEEGNTPPDPPEMDPQADDEDAAKGAALRPMTANSGKKLGERLGAHADTRINVTYPGRSAAEHPPLQWAPHHLIPGNASLKGSKIVPYLGCDKVIAKYGSGSKIKDKQSVGYDVNSGSNGVWLPSPYALSMKGNWPVDPAAKDAYVEAAIDQNGEDKQFHMSHTQYSLKVQEIIDALGDKLTLLTSSSKCDKADGKKNDKFDAPRGLIARLDGVSHQMKRFVSGPVWRPPLFTDDTLMAAYVRRKNMKQVQGLKGNVTPIKIGTR